MTNGSFDLLKDTLRKGADEFAARYQALRKLEGWADDTGKEDPETGPRPLWRQRLKPLMEAAAILNPPERSGMRQLIVDVGSGGGWTARYFPGQDLLAIDLVSSPCAATICIRADMRDLPLRNDVADGMLFAASLHYAPLTDVVPEIKRVLRRGGLVVAVDSPIYGSRQAQEDARSRSRDYFATRGFPSLIDHYHPIEATDLRRILSENGFTIRRFDVGLRNRALAAIRRGPPATIVVAEKR